MKFETLNRRPKRVVGGDLTPAEQREFAKNRREFLEQAWPHKSGVNTFSAADAELESMLLDNCSDYVRAGRVDAVGDKWKTKTVQRFGWACIAHGWSIVPQEREGTRNPSRIPYTVGAGLKAKELSETFYPTQWREKRHSIRQFLQLGEVWDANLALQCCAASSHIRILDIDCRDAETAKRVMQTAFDILGVTPFVRYGARPKVQLIYRVQGDDIGIGRWSITFKNADGSPDVDEDGHPINAVEWLAEGGIFTAYGLHHKTKKSFEWEGLHPAIAGPELAPIVTKGLLRQFTNALEAVRPIVGGVANSNPHGGRSVITEFDRRGNGRIWVPKISQGQWSVDAEGYVTDGAETWATAHAWALCAANAGDLRRLMPIIEDYLTAHACNVLGKRRRDHGDYSSDERIMRAVRLKLKAAADKWHQSIDSFMRTGRYLPKIIPWGINEDGTRPVAQRIAPAGRPADGSLDWIPDDTCPVEALADSMPTARVSIDKKTVEATMRDAFERQLIENLELRHKTAAKVSSDVRGHVRGFFDSISESPFHLLKAPTGAGKTVAFWAEVAAFIAANPRRNQAGDLGPILFVVPSHANANESMLVAERNGLFSAEFWSEDDIDSIHSMVGRSVRVERFKGRSAAGMCGRQEELKALSDKSIGASGLCEKTVDAVSDAEAKLTRREGGDVEQIKLLCPIRAAGECGYYNQFDKLANADIIVITHAYLTMRGLPKVLKTPRAVIIDESVTYAALNQGYLPLWAFELQRKRPYVTKSDRARFADWTIDQIADAYYADRLEAADLAKTTIQAGKELGTVFRDLKRGRALVEAAILVCERSHDADRAVRPDVTPEAVKLIARKETAKHLLLEKRFWKTLLNRMDLLDAGDAKGDREMRFQAVMHPDSEMGLQAPHVRISWGTPLNWSDRPLLLLDASANKRIMGKVFGRDPVEHVVDAPLHVRTVAAIEKTWSTSSFIPAWDASDDEKAQCAANIASARSLITITAVVYGYGRVIVGTTMKVREVLTGGGWLPPANIDFVHFGALRGLDFAKDHVCAISIGRTEQPISIIDGYAAALTYDDDQPEEPYDRSGMGLTPEGRPLFRPATSRKMMMRTGQDVSHNIPQMPGKMVLDTKGEVVVVKIKIDDGRVIAARSWGQDLEESWREEELRQFLGRLRPVFRGVAVDADGVALQVEPPVWLCIGKVQPPGIIVDEVVEVSQLIKPAPVYDMVRLGDGIFDEHVMAAVPAVREMMGERSLKEIRAAYMPGRNSYILRLISAMDKVVYRLARDEPGRQRSGYVASAMVEGDVAEHYLAVAKANGIDVVVVSVESSARRPKSRVKAQPDKVDARLASRDERLEAELNIRAIAARAKLSPAETEVRLLQGDRVAGIKLVEEEVEYDPDIEEGRLRYMAKTSNGDQRADKASTGHASPIELLAKVRRYPFSVDRFPVN